MEVGLEADEMRHHAAMSYRVSLLFGVSAFLNEFTYWEFLGGGFV
jgi:hypothetical protein